MNLSHGGSNIHATLNLMLIDFIMFLQSFMFASDIPMLNFATIIADLYTPLYSLKNHEWFIHNYPFYLSM